MNNNSNEDEEIPLIKDEYEKEQLENEKLKEFVRKKN